MLPLDFQILQLHASLLLAKVVIDRALFELCEGHRESSKILMFATWDRSEEFKLDLSLNLILAKICGANLDLVPLEAPARLSDDLTLVDGRVLSRSNIPIDYEEAETVVIDDANRIEDHDFSVGSWSDLFSRDYDTTRLSYSASIAAQRLGHNLIAGCDDLVERELKNADVVMGSQLLSLIRTIIRVVHLYLELLLLLKMEVNHDLLDELRVQIIMDQLRLANLLPLVVHCLVENAEWIRFAESVHIGQFLALEA